MDIVHPRCCGLDIHKKTVVACVFLSQPDGSVDRHVHTFATMTEDLLALRDWLASLGVSDVALESTGVYWRPVFNVLEDDERTLLLVNPQHMRAVPGKKSDVRDSEWLADLLRHGLLRASVIPPAPIRAVRELTRYRCTSKASRYLLQQSVARLMTQGVVDLLEMVQVNQQQSKTVPFGARSQTPFQLAAQKHAIGYKPVSSSYQAWYCSAASASRRLVMSWMIENSSCRPATSTGLAWTSTSRTCPSDSDAERESGSAAA